MSAHAELQARLQAAGRDERSATGALYLEAAEALAAAENDASRYRWRPIETFPADWSSDDFIFSGRFGVGVATNIGELSAAKPTHWMPLPDPPK